MMAKEKERSREKHVNVVCDAALAGTCFGGGEGFFERLLSY